MDYTELDLIIANTPGFYLKAGYFTEVKANFQELRADLTTAEGETDTLRTDLMTAEDEIDTLQTDLTTAEGEIDTLQDDVAALQGETFSTTFNGTDGQTITFANPDSASAKGIVTPNEDPVGNYWLVFDSATQATLHNSDAGASGAVTVTIILY